MLKKLTLVAFVCLTIMPSSAFPAGSFGGLVVPNMGQLKGTVPFSPAKRGTVPTWPGEISYYMDAPWGRLYVTEQGLLLNVIQDVEQAPSPAMSAFIPQPWAAMPQDTGGDVGRVSDPANPAASERRPTTSPFANGGAVPILAKEGLGEISSNTPATQIPPTPFTKGREGPMRGKFAHAAKSGDSPSPLPTALVQSPFFAIRQTGILLTLPGACWREVVPEDPQITKLNFFYGNDPKGWVTDVPTYGRLRIKNIFPGTDLVLSPRSRELWHMEGPSAGLSNIMVTKVNEKLQAFGVPFSDIGPFHQASRLSPSSPHQTSEALADRRQRDAQTLLWGTYLGGYGADYIQAMELDASGNIVVAGYTQSWDFPVPGGFDTEYNGSFDIFAAKLSADGRQLLWGTFIGGYYDDIAWALALDAGMNIVLVGSTGSYDAPVSADAFDPSFNGGGPLYLDIYTVKLSAAGNALLWGTYIGGRGDEEALACVLDESGSIFLTGYTSSLDIPVPGGFDILKENSYHDIYIAKLSPDGSNLEWGSYLGGSRPDQAASICLDSNDNIVIAGYTYSNDIPVPGGYDTTLGYSGNMYLAKISTIENALIWGTYLGGNGGESAISINLDDLGFVYVLGMTYSLDIPVPGGYDTTFNGASDMYAAKLSPDGNRLLWGTYLGGDSYEYPYAAILDGAGNMIIVGSTLSADMPVPRGYDSVLSESLDIYIA